MRRFVAAGFGLVLMVTALAACRSEPAPPAATVEEVATGLLNPVGLALLPDGSLLVAEEGTGAGDLSAGVSLVGPSGTHRILSGLPSSVDSGDLSGVPLVGVAPDGSAIYTAHFDLGGLYVFQLPPAKAVEEGVVLGPEDLTLTMTARNRVRLVNPFDITFGPGGEPVVTDASENGVAMRDADGLTRFIHRFGELRDPRSEGPGIDPVPTGISRFGEEYFVALTGGCPYPEASGRVVAIDGDRGERVVVDGLNMPIDVAHEPDGTLWVLEFARFDPDASCFAGTGYRPGTGRLSRLRDGNLEVMVDGLDRPTGLALADDGSVYVSELAAGRVVRISFDAAATRPPVPVPAESADWRFVNAAGDAGLDFVHHGLDGPPEPAAQMGGGVCWLDADADGWLDLYLVDFAAGSALYRNVEGRFTEVSRQTGAGITVRGMGCAAGDLNGDGATDLVVTTDGVDRVLINQGAGAFTARGLGSDEWTTSVALADVDGDGDIDVFVGAYLDLAVTIDKPSGAFPQDYPGRPNHLYLNDGTGRLRDVAGAAGLVDERRTLGAVFTDFDRDGDPDLYVANDGETNRLYENRRGMGPLGFQFVDITDRARTDDSGSGMGIAAGDFDADGSTDLFVTNWDRELHALYRGDPSGVFSYGTFRIGFAGLGAGTTGWGTSWGDFDNDTDLDLFIANGHVPVTDPAVDAENLQLFGNLRAERGLPVQLADWSDVVGLDAIGPVLARGSAAADYDNDGDLDVAVNQVGGPALLLRNDGPADGWIGVAVTPPDPGTVVEVILADGQRLRRELIAGSSYLSSEDPRLLIGIGRHAEATVTVTWPDGSARNLGSVPARTWMTATKP